MQSKQARLTHFFGYIGVATNIHVEFTVIRHGLLVAKEIGTSLIHAETDSFETVRLIENKNSSTYFFGVIIDEIRKNLDENIDYCIFSYSRKS